MKDRLRLLPRDFLREWIQAFGMLPTEDFLDVYETTYEALYYGFQTKEPWDESGKKGKRLRPSYFFADPSFLWVTKRANERIAAVTAALRRRRRADEARRAKGLGRPSGMAQGTAKGQGDFTGPIRAKEA